MDDQKPYALRPGFLVVALLTRWFNGFLIKVMRKKTAIILAIIALVFIVSAGVYYGILRKRAGKGAQQFVGSAGFDIGTNIGDISELTANPLKNMPSANPLEKVVNPFRDLYKNPFK